MKINNEIKIKRMKVKEMKEGENFRNPKTTQYMSHNRKVIMNKLQLPTIYEEEETNSDAKNIKEQAKAKS